MGGYINLTGKIFGASLAAWGLGKILSSRQEEERHMTVEEGKEYMRGLAMRGEWEEFNGIMTRAVPEMSTRDKVALWNRLKNGEE